MTSRKLAFSLAEVLVTLAVIGVVASLTIPSLLKSSFNAEVAAKVKKYKSILQQVVLEYSAENDCVGNLPACYAFTNSAGPAWTQERWNALKSKLKVVKDCGTNPNQGCFYTGMYRQLNGSDWSSDWDSSTSYAKGILVDGTSIRVSSVSGETLVDVWIDINGSKSPNQIGRDVFNWSIKRTGKVNDESCPSSGDGELINEYCDPSGGDWTSKGMGVGCGCRILIEGKVNY